MRRRDYELLHKALRAAQMPEHACNDGINCGVERAAEHIADALAADNRAFDKARFLTDCGVAE